MVTSRRSRKVRCRRRDAHLRRPDRVRQRALSDPHAHSRLWGKHRGGEIVSLSFPLCCSSASGPAVHRLELFIGFIQAFVFAFLVLLYIILALESHGGEEHEAHEPETHASEEHNEALPKAA